MPRTATPAWIEEVAPDLAADETFEAVHQVLEHTIGNLTLTGYNSTLSNSAFPIKKKLLASSGLRMNQEIAAVERWGRSSILDRAQQIADRVASVWPAPANVSEQSELTPAWQMMAKAVAELAQGAWTTYGDLAALIGSHGRSRRDADREASH